MPIISAASLQEIPPFFAPGAPPPSLPALIAQTQIGNVQSPPKLIAQEQLAPSVKRFHRAHNHARSPISSPQTPSSQSAKAPVRSYSEQPSSHARLHVPSPKTPPPRNGKLPVRFDSEQPSSSDKSSESDSDTDEEDLIPKPEGEAGRPGRGGYNLQEALGWKAKEYRALKKYVKKLVAEQLDPKKNFSSQALASLLSVQATASTKFPELRSYADCWPVADLIRLELKYTCGRARLEVQKEAAKAAKRLTRNISK